MSSFLHRLGKFAARRGWIILGVWALMLGTLGSALAFGAAGNLNNDFNIPGTQSQDGLDVIAQRFPELSGTDGQLLFEVPPGRNIFDVKTSIEKVIEKARKIPSVKTVTSPFSTQFSTPSISTNKRYALAIVQFDFGLGDLNKQAVEQFKKLSTTESSNSIKVHVGGTVLQTTEVKMSLTEVAGVLLALIILAITFASVLAAGLPIVTALLAVGTSMAAMFIIAAFTPISTTTPTLAVMLGLAVGIDYSLFIVSRHRAQLGHGMDIETSIARATATAGAAVIFAAVTVVIALCGLAVAQIPFLTVMGLVAAGAVAIAGLVSVTVIPALLGILGERLRPRKAHKTRRAKQKNNAFTNSAEEKTSSASPTPTPRNRLTMGERWLNLVTRFPWATVVIVLLITIISAIPAKDLRLAIPANGVEKIGTPGRTTYDLVTREFGEGANAPLLVTGDIITSRDPLKLMKELGEEIETIPGVSAVKLSTPNRNGDLGAVIVIPKAGQASAQTEKLVHDLRQRFPQWEKKYDMGQPKVTGFTAVTVDISERLSAALIPFGIVVMGLSLILLMIVFRSIAIPIKATIGYLLSVLSAFGVTSAVFTWGWFNSALNINMIGPVICFMPIVLMGVLFGLAMDYEVFLVSGMREKWVHTKDAKLAIPEGFRISVRVVTAAALIMISVFAAFVPEGTYHVQPIALGLAVGVFVDAFLVRMSLVPAVMVILGKSAWWIPAWLDRMLPHLDVEGSSLDRHDEHTRWSAENGNAVVRIENLTLKCKKLWEVKVPRLIARQGERYDLSGDRISRRAMCYLLAGKLLPENGTVVVMDRLLPEESAAVRARVLVTTSTQTLNETLQVALRRGPKSAPLVLIDTPISREDETKIEKICAQGGTVIVGVPGAQYDIQLFPHKHGVCSEKLK